MDKYQILLNVRGSQEHDGEESTMELLTEGILTREDDKYIIEYEESELSGMENTLTRVILDGQNVSLERSGAWQSSFEFIHRQRYEAVYETPFGSMQMSVMPTQVQSELSSEKGSVDLEYVIQVGEQSALNRLNINYKLKN